MPEDSRVPTELHLQSSSSHQLDSIFFPLLAHLQHILELVSCSSKKLVYHLNCPVLALNSDKMCCDIDNVGFGEDDDGGV
ncbi:hypothetical protein Tco_1130047 [Tanacetum coccineum]